MSSQLARTILVDGARPDRQVLAEAAAILRRGGLVVFPTETVYGVGANAYDAVAVGRIYAAKGRPPDNPLIVHVGDESMARQVAAAWPDQAELLARRFWPGPLTLVLPRMEQVPDVVTAGGPTVAIRMPKHPVAVELIRAAGVPVAAPSANRSSRISPTRAEHARASLGDAVDLILDAGPTACGLESTVLDLTADPPVVLRPGPITVADLKAAIGPVVTKASVAPGPLRSPGLMARHYAPRCRLELAASPGERDIRRAALLAEGRRVGVLAIHPTDSLPDSPAVVLGDDPRIYGRQLYEALHRFDSMGLDVIIADLPPAQDEWQAVRDRLTRAAR